MLERFLQKIQDLSYGNLGISLATGGATFTIFATLMQVLGIPGSILIFVIFLYLSTVIAFIVFFLLNKRQHERQLRIRESIKSTEVNARSRCIGVVAPISFWSTNYYVEIIRAIRIAADRERRDIQRKIVVVDVAHEDSTDVEEILSDVLIEDVQGLILINIKLSDHAREKLFAYSIPIVNITHQDNKPPSVCSILPDHAGFEDVVNHAIIEKKSNASILVMKEISNPYKNVKVDAFRKEKRDIFQSASRKAGLVVHNPLKLLNIEDRLQIEPGNAYIIEIEQYLENYGDVIYEKLVHSVPPNTSFVFLADIVAIGFMNSLRKHNINPDKLFRIIGFDNTKESSWFDLSTVDYQLDVVGRLAYEKLQMALDYPGRFFYTEEKVRTIGIIRGSSNW